MWRRLLLAAALTVGVVAPVVAPAQPAAAGVITTLWNGKCAVKVGFNPSSAWLQVWSSGTCALVSIQAADNGCYYWSTQRFAVNANGLTFGLFLQTSNIPGGRGAYYAYVYPRSTSGSIRDGTVSLWGTVTGW